MFTIRRLYLYGVSAIALALMAVGAGSLIELAFERLGRAIAGTGVIGPGLDRELLALSVALLLVGLPLWLVHWWLAERSVRRDTPEADAERRSVIRALYLAGVAAVALGYLATGGVAFVETLIRAPASWPVDLAGPLAHTLVALAVLAFHIRTRILDTAAGSLAGAAAWLGRLYLYGAVVGGAFVGLWGVSRAIEVVGNEVLGTGAIGTAFRFELANAVALTVVGALVWLAHAWYARRLPTCDDWRGEAERASLVRAAHGVVGAGIATVISIFAVASTLGWLFGQALGVGAAADTARAIQQTVGPLAAMLPFLVGGVLFGALTVREASRFRGPEAAVAARRSLRLTIAGIGLAIGSVGLVRALGVTVEAALGPAAIGGIAYQDEIARMLPYAVVGLPTWLVAWALVLRDGAGDRLGEARSMARRLYLFLVVGVSVTSAGLALAFLIYQGLRVVLDIGYVEGWELGQPFVIVVVGAVALLYHLWVLRGDLALKAIAEPTVAPAAEGVAAVVEELVLEGPAGSDVEAVNRVLREHLPSGWTMRVVHHGAGAGH